MATSTQNPVVALACGNEGQMNLKGGLKNEGDLLGTFVHLLISESEDDAAQLAGSVEEALRTSKIPLKRRIPQSFITL